jgi:hypothetical protein
MKYKSVLTDKQQALLSENGWLCWGKPAPFESHDETWARPLYGVLPRCFDVNEKPLQVELLIYKKPCGFPWPKKLRLGIELVVVGTKQDFKYTQIKIYGFPEGELDMTEIDKQTAQLVSAWKAMHTCINT